MIRVSEEKFMERFEAVPQILRDFTISVEVGDMLWKIGEVHHLQEEKIRKIAAVLSYIALGLIHIEDLSKEIVSETHIDRRLADELAREIQVKILAPVIPEIQRLYYYGATGATPTPEAAPAQPETLRPAFAPPEREVSGERREVRTSGPFILQKEQEEIERVRPVDESLMRPSFYEGAPGSMNQESRITNERAAARLEIPSTSSGQAEKKEPQVGKTEEPQIRVVHYSGPQTPVDPFDPSANPAQEVPEKPAAPPSDVHPENVVDLKDLPR